MKIKELRKQNKKTQQEIAECLNVTQVTYGRYELGICEPTLETLCTLANFYGVTVDYLIGRDSNEFAYLSQEEKTLISEFRALNTNNKNQLLGVAHGMKISQDSKL